ncbi:hypothetical protein ACF0H5_009617 [Mactra antiquata]
MVEVFRIHCDVRKTTLLNTWPSENNILIVLWKGGKFLEMGKVKRARQKAHTAAVKVKSGDEKTKETSNEATMDTDQGQFRIPPLGTNLFEGIDLSKYDIKKELPDFDTRSTITSKSFKGLNMKKKEKQKLRHDLWIQKLNAIDVAKKKAAEKKRKAETPVVGDIGSLGEALPTLELLMKKSTGPKNNRNEDKKPKGIQKERKRKKQMMNDISIFRQVIKHPAFKENPSSTISEHLHNRQKQEDMES